MATSTGSRGAMRDPAHEALDRAGLRKLQGDKLAQLVARVYQNVPFYRDSFDKAGVSPEQIKSLDDISRLPFTYKRDLRDQYPFGLFAVPLKEIVRIHASSGTTGKPTTEGYTRGDIDVWSECMARTMAAGGVTDDDIVQNAYGYGLFTGGLGAHYGAERLGAAVIPISGGNTQKQLMLMQDYSSTVLCSTPSFALYIWDVANEMGIDMASLPLRVGIFGAEPWSEAMRREIEEKLAIKAIDIYGLSEITGPGVSFECAEVQQGLHVNEDHFLAEIINPDTGETVPDGEMGELVFTTLSKEGIPLIRYRTGDITRLNVDTCGCGRTFARMDRVSGRSDDMLIIRGVNVFPTQVESVLLQSPEVEPHYRLIVEREGSMDTLAVEVEINCDLYQEAKAAILSDDDFVVLGEYETLRQLRGSIKNNIKDIIGVTAEIRLKEPGAIERSEGKAKRVIDNRPK